MSDYLKGNPGQGLRIAPDGAWLCPECGNGSKSIRLDARDRVVASTCQECGFDWLAYKASGFRELAAFLQGYFDVVEVVSVEFNVGEPVRIEEVARDE